MYTYNTGMKYDLLLCNQSMWKLNVATKIEIHRSVLWLCAINVSTETDNTMFLYNNFAPRDYLGLLIHKDVSPMYFATGSIMKTRLYAIFHEKTAFFQVMQ